VAAVITLTAEDRRELARWIMCGAIVLAAHAGIATAFMQWHDPIYDEGDAGAGTVVIELSPLPVNPDKIDLPPGPEQVQAESTPDQPEEQKPEEKMERLPEQQSDVSLAPEPAPQTKPREEAPPAPATTAPQAPRARAAVRTWQTQVVSILEHNKRYPAEARSHGEQGVAQLTFSIDREGRVLSSKIVKSSGFPALDNETLALVQRAQPFPAPPPDLAGPQITLTVPLRFNIR
jgi:periplasmic protein TonB